MRIEHSTLLYLSRRRTGRAAAVLPAKMSQMYVAYSFAHLCGGRGKRAAGQVLKQPHRREGKPAREIHCERPAYAAEFHYLCIRIICRNRPPYHETFPLSSVPYHRPQTGGADHTAVHRPAPERSGGRRHHRHRILARQLHRRERQPRRQGRDLLQCAARRPHAHQRLQAGAQGGEHELHRGPHIHRLRHRRHR